MLVEDLYIAWKPSTYDCASHHARVQLGQSYRHRHAGLTGRCKGKERHDHQNRRTGDVFRSRSPAQETRHQNQTGLYQTCRKQPCSLLWPRLVRKATEGRITDTEAVYESASLWQLVKIMMIVSLTYESREMTTFCSILDRRCLWLKRYTVRKRTLPGG